MKSAENFGTCRRINATYAATREETMQRNIVLDHNESVIAQMMVFQKKSLVATRTGSIVANAAAHVLIGALRLSEGLDTGDSTRLYSEQNV